MFIYIILLSYIVLLSLIFEFNNKRKDNKRKIIFLIFAFIPIIFVSGLRSPKVGIDTMQYVNAFNQIKYMSITDFSSLRFEYGFSLLCLILSKITSNPQILLFVTSLIINYSISIFIYKNSKNIYFSTILYLICNFFFSSMNIMRQALAIAIILLGYDKLKENKYVNFVFYVLCASFFHSSAILALLYIPLRQFKFTKKTSLILLILTTAAFLYGKNIFMFLARFSPRLYDYLDSSFITENYFGSLLDFLVYFISFFFGIYLINFHSKTEKNNDLIELSTIIGNMGFAVIFSVMIMRVILFNRFTPYFTIFLIIWIPNCLNLIKKSKDKLLLSGFIFIAFCLYWIVIMIYRPEWYGVIPYKMFF